MKSQFTNSLITLCLCVLVAFLTAGCENSLRLAPSESMKQNAELTHFLAAKVNSEGAQPASLATRKLVRGTQASLTYTGRPKVPPDPEQFETISTQANIDAAQRPDPWATADAFLELGIGIAGLAGGVYGVKTVKFLKQAREKSKALQEIVQGNEIFKKTADAQENAAFKQAHNTAQKSAATKRLVTELKTTS